MLYAVAMAYVESAVVVYLRAALGVPTGSIFPIDLSPAVTPFGWIEVGREGATLVMIGAVAWIAGRSPLERLAWAAVVFGTWDIGYYAWLWVFSGWPPSLGTWDLLFLLPAPWAGPVWAPIAVSAALIGFGLACAGRLRAGLSVRFDRRHLGALLLGGAIVIVSFLTNAGPGARRRDADRLCLADLRGRHGDRDVRRLAGAPSEWPLTRRPDEPTIGPIRSEGGIP